MSYERLLLALLTTAVIILAGLFAHAVGTRSEPGPDDLDAGQVDVQRLRSLTRTENQALLVADTDGLGRLLADDFTAVTVDGEQLSGGQLIAAIGSGDLDVRSFRIDEFGPEDPIEVHLDGNVATVTYQAEMEIASHPLDFRHDSAGARRDRRLRTRHTDTWIRSDSNWRQIRAATSHADVLHLGP
jgi:hypothetical protein